MSYKRASLIILLFFSLFSLSFAMDFYNAGSDFSVGVNSLKGLTYTDNIESNLTFVLMNTRDYSKTFTINLTPVSGWDIKIAQNKITLGPREKKNITIFFKANDKFAYSTSIVSSDVIKISQDDNYKGYFKFPIFISDGGENITMNYQVEVDAKNEPENYFIGISTEPLSPIHPLKYNINAKNLKGNDTVDVILYFDSKKVFENNYVFTKKNHFQFFSYKIPTNFTHGKYLVKVVVRTKAQNSNKINEWEQTAMLNVVKYDKVIVSSKEKKNFFKDSYLLDIKNEGNMNSIFQKQVNFNFLKGLFFSTNGNYLSNKNGVLLKINLKRGEEKKIEFGYNYAILYIILLLLTIFIVWYYIRKNSNPISTDVKFYDIKRVENEGVKKFKVRIGFENVKESEISELKLIFKMPSYLNIKEDSFLLSEPNQVLKGRTQYKLIWKFKRFEKSDSRILGFTLENNRGILGDIKLEDMELELKVGGKIKRYFKSLPIIKGQ